MASKRKDSFGRIGGRLLPASSVMSSGGTSVLIAVGGVISEEFIQGPSILVETPTALRVTSEVDGTHAFDSRGVISVQWDLGPNRDPKNKEPDDATWTCPYCGDLKHVFLSDYTCKCGCRIIAPTVQKGDQ